MSARITGATERTMVRHHLASRAGSAGRAPVPKPTSTVASVTATTCPGAGRPRPSGDLQLLRCPDHERTNLVNCVRPVVHDTNELPAGKNGDPPAQLDELVEVRRNNDCSGALVHQVADDRADVLGRLEVKAVRRLMEDHDLRVERKLPGQQELLRVAAGQGPGPGVQPGRADVERLHHCARLGVDTPPVDPPPLPERRLTDALEEDVERDPQVADDALAEPVIGHVAQAESLPG